MYPYILLNNQKETEVLKNDYIAICNNERFTFKSNNVGRLYTLNYLRNSISLCNIYIILFLRFFFSS